MYIYDLFIPDVYAYPLTCVTTPVIYVLHMPHRGSNWLSTHPPSNNGDKEERGSENLSFSQLRAEANSAGQVSMHSDQGVGR